MMEFHKNVFVSLLRKEVRVVYCFHPNFYAEQWEAKLELSEPPSYLYCEPVFFTSTEYDFFVETEDRDVRHSSKSYLHRAYENHIPVFT